MRGLRAAFAWALLMIGWAIVGVGAAWAAEGQDVYDQLKAGTKVLQDREYDTPEKPTVYLTFDDGPGKLTPQVLDLLKEADVKATFFVLGEHVYQSPDAVRRMTQEGHAIGNHTFNHQYNNLYPAFRLFWDQIGRTEQALAETAGVTTNLVRAPGGTFSHFDAYYFYYLDQAGYSVFDWNVDSGDSLRANVPKNEIVQNVKNTPLKHEMIVLMHDSAGHEETIRALPEIIQFYKDKGYQFATLSERVKPVQQAIDRKKAGASLSRAEHEQWTQNMQAVASHKAPVNVAAAAEVANVADSPVSVVMATQTVTPPPPPPPLRLHFGSSDMWELSGTEYEFRHDKLFVPLRGLSERMGAVVAWDEAHRTAIVRYGMHELRVDLQRHAISVQVPGKPNRIYPMADIGLRDGSVIVPLRLTVELLGDQVDSYSLGDTLREVKLDTSTRGYHFTPIPKLTMKV